MSNIWGMCFSFAIPLLILIVLVHIEVVEEKKINKSIKRRIK
jgi:hypothetical protein